jgi:hypothetical protein
LSEDEDLFLEDPEGVRDIVATRHIREVVHFTTNRGVLGVLVTKSLKSRALLNESAYLEYLFTPNAIFRQRDAAWLPYVSLSIARINSAFFNISSNKWHVDEPMWWCVLSFDPVILSHPGVYFVSTNNAYRCARRGRGPEGLEALFEPEVQEYDSGTMARRPTNLPSDFTTSVQAEVLYPGEISTDLLRVVYVTRSEDKASVESWCEMFGHDGVRVLLRDDLKHTLQRTETA